VRTVDGRRNFPQDPGERDPEGRWYPEDRGYVEQPEWERRSEEARGPDSYQIPEPRSAQSYGYGDLPPAPAAPPMPPVGPRSGEPLPPPIGSGAGGLGGSFDAFGGPGGGQGGRMLADPQGHQTGELPLEDLGRRRPVDSMDRTALRRTVPVSGPGQAGGTGGEPTGSVYRGRRPGLAALLILLTVLFELPVLRIFVSAALASRADAAGTIASIFMILGLPTFALGLYGLIGGAAAAAQGSRAWLRTPLVYLPVGVLLFLAAALAA
jgi:hypothetical protein